MPRMAVISPGMGFSNVVTQEDGPEIDGDLSQLTGGATKSFACNLVRSGAITSCSSWYGFAQLFSFFHKTTIVCFAFKLRSTLHKVIGIGQDRYSIAYFLEPGHHCLVECLPTCKSELNPPK
ncbi:2-oxoglutarate (2OG) and Fe(II)-dependent oxygenase superfamily protein [Trifolium repens]|nr:2-oxoglutarate (2OG) and Fe(II)-dependent oxygenase superfamily protein [Trifolium repens]